MVFTGMFRVRHLEGGGVKRAKFADIEKQEARSTRGVPLLMGVFHPQIRERAHNSITASEDLPDY